MSANPLVSTEWLAAHLNDPDLRIVDVRWYLFEKDKNGRQEYLRGHVPGAAFLDIEADLSSPPGQGPGRHPLPSPAAFAAAASRAGIDAAKHVVAYDDRGGASAARLWWLLRYFGHARASLLDGGINRWMAETRPFQTEVPSLKSTVFVAKPNPDMLVDRAQVSALGSDPSALVLDSRLRERYEGIVEPIDPKAGHIPGARNAPLAGNLRSPDDPRFLDSASLRARFDALGASHASRIVAYCGSGVNACQNILALELAGYKDALLYQGSWSDWSSDDSAPVAVGPEP
ncbi:MAG: sulfurtransferase [Chloroflexi bacterium]|nr:sulfurtransferase [Chloroflexota bacterium]